MRSPRRYLPCLLMLLAGLVSSALARPGGGNEPSVGEGAFDAARVQRWLRAGLDVGGARALGSGLGRGNRRVRPGLYEVRVGAAQTGYVSIGSLPNGPTALLAAGVGGTAVLVRIFVPATGFDEVFLLYVPPTDPTELRPLLVTFHGYGSSQGSIATQTRYLREAELREWFLVAPIQSGGPGYAETSYGSVQSQEHVEAVLGLLLDVYAIDRDQIFGVGFSMGGGSVTNYAARHRDRRSGAFAAIVNHTGSVSLSDTYRFVDTGVQVVMRALFGGTPLENPFDWTRASSIVLDAASQLVPDANHMAINLTSTPVKTIYGLTDTQGYLVNQSIQLDAFFQSTGSTNHILEPTVVPSNCPGNHCWATADEVLVCDWLKPNVLDSNPASGTVLMDRSARWHQFDVELDSLEKFGGFDFTLDVQANALTLLNVTNIDEVGLNVVRAGLDPDEELLLEIESPEAGGDEYRLGSLAGMPSVVERNANLQVDPACPSTPQVASWCFDVDTGELVLHEPGGAGLASWRIVP